MNEWMKSLGGEDNRRALLQYIFNMWTVSSGVSIQGRHCQPLSVHLWGYCTHPTDDENDVICEGWPQHRGLHPLLFSNSGMVVFTSVKNQVSVSALRRDLRLSSLSEKTTIKSNRLQVLVRPGFELMLIYKLLHCESMKFLLRKSFCSSRKGKSRNFVRSDVRS